MNSLGHCFGPLFFGNSWGPGTQTPCCQAPRAMMGMVSGTECRCIWVLGPTGIPTLGAVYEEEVLWAIWSLSTLDNPQGPKHPGMSVSTLKKIGMYFVSQQDHSLADIAWCCLHRVKEHRAGCQGSNGRCWRTQDRNGRAAFKLLG